MKQESNGLYSAFCAKDVRFDGRFYVGVTTSKIYCRPVCSAKMPKEENCVFFSSAAEAEQAGYRPCQLCRPELAPGAAMADGIDPIAVTAARMIEENCGNGESLEEIAEKKGFSSRHFRRFFKKEYNVTPVQYLQCCRLLLAKNLLTDTDLHITDIAMAAGYGSTRRFNDVFKEKYNITPTEYRRQISHISQKSADITITLGYRPPYLWKEMLAFLKERAIPNVEAVIGNTYCRTVSMKNTKKLTLTGYVSVTDNCEKNALEVTVSETLLPVLPQIIGRVRNMFDLYCDPEMVYNALLPLNEIKADILKKGVRLPGCFEPFEMSVRAILGQQITVKAATTLSGRIAEKYGTPVNTPFEELTMVFPTAEEVARLDNIEKRFGEQGVITIRTRAINALAESVSCGEICFEKCNSPESEIKKLLSIKGIGNWTANYIAMRTMAWTDAFLETDIGIKNALPDSTSKELLKLSEQWRPWRSYAVISIWNSKGN